MRYRRTGILPLVLLLAVGCAPSRNTEILEARLRQHEDQLAEVQTQLVAAQSEARIAQQQADDLHAQLAGRSESTLLPEQSAALYSVDKIELSKLMTGSLDRDGEPGDEMLSAVLLPLDEQGSLVKVPGLVDLELLDLSQPDNLRRIGNWRFEPEETRKMWHRGLVSSGYVFQLPWQQAPASSNLLLHVRMTTADGRMFETQREIAVNLPSNEPPRLRVGER